MKLGTTELLIILAVVVIIFGPTQIPKLTRMFGKSVREFRNGIADADEESKTTVTASKTESPDEKVDE